MILESLPLQDPESDIIDGHQSDEIHCDEKVLIEDKIEMIKFNNSEHSAHSNSVSRESNIMRWGLRLSRLTAGYLPGDLAGIVRRAAGQIIRNYDDFRIQCIYRNLQVYYCKYFNHYFKNLDKI